MRVTYHNPHLKKSNGAGQQFDCHCAILQYSAEEAFKIGRTGHGTLEYLPSPTFSKGRTQAFGWSRKGTRLGTAPRIEERIIRLTLQSGPMLIALPNFKHCWGSQDLGTLPVVAASPDFQAWLSRIIIIIIIIIYKYI